MSLLTGTFSFTRFFVFDALPENYHDSLLKGVNDNRFQSIPPDSELKESCGWTLFDDFSSTEFHTGNIFYGEFLTLQMRIDKRRIPPKLLKLERRLAINEFIKATGKKRPGFKENRQINERVERNLLKKMPAVPDFFEMAWNLQENFVLLGSVSSKVIEQFMNLFEDSFSVKLYEASMRSLFWKNGDLRKSIEQWDQAEPTVFV